MVGVGEGNDVTVVVATATDVAVVTIGPYPAGGHSSGEWKPTLSRDHVSSRAPEWLACIQRKVTPDC